MNFRFFFRHFIIFLYIAINVYLKATGIFWSNKINSSVYSLITYMICLSIKMIFFKIEIGKNNSITITYLPYQLISITYKSIKHISSINNCHNIFIICSPIYVAIYLLSGGFIFIQTTLNVFVYSTVSFFFRIFKKTFTYTLDCAQ